MVDCSRGGVLLQVKSSGFYSHFSHIRMIQYIVKWDDILPGPYVLHRRLHRITKTYTCVTLDSIGVHKVHMCIHCKTVQTLQYRAIVDIKTVRHRGNAALTSTQSWWTYTLTYNINIMMASYKGHHCSYHYCSISFGLIRPLTIWPFNKLVHPV